jgi:hypothetical protein
MSSAQRAERAARPVARASELVALGALGDQRRDGGGDLAWTRCAPWRRATMTAGRQRMLINYVSLAGVSMELKNRQRDA